MSTPQDEPNVDLSPASEAASSPLAIRPIGVVRSPYVERYGTPRQATVKQGGEAVVATLELDPEQIPVEALRDLDGFSHIWVICWFHLNQGWRPLITPIRGPRAKRGLFATRAPHRPNPIGLSALEIVAVHGHNIEVRGIDLLDGTPILDIKPYVPYADAFPDARAGWLELIDGPMDGPDRPTQPPRRKARDGQ